MQVAIGRGRRGVLYFDILRSMRPAHPSPGLPLLLLVAACLGFGCVGGQSGDEGLDFGGPLGPVRGEGVQTESEEGAGCHGPSDGGAAGATAHCAETEEDGGGVPDACGCEEAPSSGAPDGCAQQAVPEPCGPPAGE